MIRLIWKLWLLIVERWRGTLELTEKRGYIKQVKTKAGRKRLWWVCGFRLKCVSENENSLPSSRILFWVLSTLFNTCSVTVFSDTFSKGGVFPGWSPHSEFTAKLVASRPEDAFFDLIANSFFLSNTTINCGQHCVSDSVFTRANNNTHFLVNPFKKHLSKVLTFTKSSWTVKLLSGLPTVKSWSPVPSTIVLFSCLSIAVLPMIKTWSKLSNWRRHLLFEVFSCQWKQSLL